MIIEKYLIDVTAKFGLDKKEIQADWIVFSDNLYDFPIAVAVEGTSPVPSLIDDDGKASGWLLPGTPYSCGLDAWADAYAGDVEIFGRKVLSGQGGQKLHLSSGDVFIIPETDSSAVVQWNATQKFSSLNWDSEGMKVKIKLSLEYEDVPFVQDQVHGYPVVNSAGQFFNPPAMMRKKTPIYTITRRELFNPLQKALDYTNVVNSDEHYGAPPGTLLMDSVIPDYDGTAWTVSYNIKQSRPNALYAEGWYTYILDTGYEQIIDGKRHKILDDDGVPISEPARLNGAGQVLPDVTGAGFQMGPFKKYAQRPFALLDLPNPFQFHTVPPMPQ